MFDGGISRMDRIIRYDQSVERTWRNVHSGMFKNKGRGMLTKYLMPASGISGISITVRVCQFFHVLGGRRNESEGVVGFN